MPARWVQTSSLAGLFVWSAGCAAPVEPPPAVRWAVPPPAVPAPPAPVQVAPARPVVPGIRVLFGDRWHGSVQLLGVDASKGRAFLRLESAVSKKKLAIDTIDVGRGMRVERWEATDARAAESVQTYPVFRPLSGTFEEDLVRFAGIVASAGPWHLRGRPFRPTVAVNAQRDLILYGAKPLDATDGEWLLVAGADGRGPRRVDAGLKASYAPVFSPDGTRIAWKGCAQSPCGYELFVSHVSKGKPGPPDRVTSVRDPAAPVWSQDGRFLYAVGRAPDGRGACVFRIAANATWDARSVACSTGSDVEFIQDPIGRTGVLASAVRSARTPATGARTVDLDVVWILLEDGQVLGRGRVEGATGIGTLGEAGLLAVPIARGGLGVADLVDGKTGSVPGDDGWFMGFETTRWTADTLLLLRRADGPEAFELVSVDARAVVGAARAGDLAR